MKRYNLRPSEEPMVRGMLGQWVRYEDAQAEIEQLQKENKRLQAYSDGLAGKFSEGMLPADVENLRNSNTAMATEIDELRRQRDLLYENFDIGLYDPMPEDLIVLLDKLEGELEEAKENPSTGRKERNEKI